MQRPIVAMFQCQSITTSGSTPTPAQHYETVQLHPVHGSGNEAWAKHTPSGGCSITITNQEALGVFKVGQVYQLTFSQNEETLRLQAQQK